MMKINILDIRIDKITFQGVLNKIEFFLESSNNHYIVTVNPEMIIAAQKDEKFKNILNKADISVPDGIGILWASKFLSINIAEHFNNVIPAKAGIQKTNSKRLDSHLHGNDKKRIKSNKILLLLYCYTVTLLKLFISGLSLIFYPKYCRQILPERISGVDLIYKICQKFQNSDYSVFFLGAENGVAEKTAKKLKEKFPNLKIAGIDSSVTTRRNDAVIPRYSHRHCEERLQGATRQSHSCKKNYLNNSGLPRSVATPLAMTVEKFGIAALRCYSARNDDDKIIQKINQAKPDILFVAFGAPKQEKWIAENLEKLSSIKLAIGVGGSFDFISGKIKRAPKFIQKIGLEWLWRFILQPWRAKRIFTATFIFAWKVLKFEIKKER